MEFTRYKLKGFLMKHYKENSEFKIFENHINEVGFLSLKLENYTTKVYTPELAFIFGSSNIQARNLDLKTDTIINGKDFIKSFIEGFKEGENYFKTEFSIDVNTLYGQNAEVYVKNIHSNFFHVLHSDQNYKGWNFVKSSYPILITEAIIKKYGYYSGIVNSVEELIKKHPVPFANFYECEEIKNSPEENKHAIKHKKSIILKNEETINKLVSELKGYFFNNESKLLNLLQGEQIPEKLYFPHNQNKLVEVFKRLKYNGFILSNDTEIKNWIYSNFTFKKKGFTEPQNFNESSVYDILSKGKGEPTKKERICIVEWLPYKGKNQLDREKESEKL